MAVSRRKHTCIDLVFGLSVRLSVCLVFFVVTITRAACWCSIAKFPAVLLPALADNGVEISAVLYCFDLRHN